MDELRKYINGLSVVEQDAFARRCGTTVGYLRKACSTGQSIGERIAINIDRESAGKVRCDILRPDVDWAYLRATPQPTTKPAAAGV